MSKLEDLIYNIKTDVKDLEDALPNHLMNDYIGYKHMVLEANSCVMTLDYVSMKKNEYKTYLRLKRKLNELYLMELENV